MNVLNNLKTGLKQMNDMKNGVIPKRTYSEFVQNNVALNLKNIKIYLLDINENMINEWSKLFNNYPNIEIVHNDLYSFLASTKVDCLVSPANSYGLMDGGYDYAITTWYGSDLMNKVQEYIINELYGEQTIGTAICIQTDSSPQYLIHSPAMRTPEIIYDYRVIYNCMRNTLIQAMKHDIKSIVVPAWGGGCGRVEPNIIANMMLCAYNQLLNTPSELSWNYALINRL